MRVRLCSSHLSEDVQQQQTGRVRGTVSGLMKETWPSSFDWMIAEDSFLNQSHPFDLKWWLCHWRELFLFWVNVLNKDGGFVKKLMNCQRFSVRACLEKLLSWAATLLSSHHKELVIVWEGNLNKQRSQRKHPLKWRKRPLLLHLESAAENRRMRSDAAVSAVSLLLPSASRSLSAENGPRFTLSFKLCCPFISRRRVKGAAEERRTEDFLWLVPS